MIKKNLSIQDIPKFLKGGINEFVNNIKKIEILHILISKYIVNGKEYFKFPNDIKSDEIIFEIDFLLREKFFYKSSKFIQSLQYSVNTNYVFRIFKKICI